MNPSDALERLRSLEPGMHHTANASAGLWFMIGRALPDTFAWSSVPPAESLSLVWGEGGCEIRHPGETLSLAPGQLLWIAAGHPHRGIGHPGSDFLTVFLPRAWSLGPEDAAPCRGAHVASADPVEERELENALLMLAVSALDGGAPEVDGTTRDLILARRAAMHQAAAGHRLAPANLKRARRLLEERFVEEIGLDQLSSVANLSPAHVSRLFVDTWGLSPIQYRKQLRLRAATRYIASGQSITEAAVKAGFSDTAHLSRTFRAQYGISPSEWHHAVHRRR